MIRNFNGVIIQNPVKEIQLRQDMMLDGLELPVCSPDGTGRKPDLLIQNQLHYKRKPITKLENETRSL